MVLWSKNGSVIWDSTWPQSRAKLIFVWKMFKILNYFIWNSIYLAFTIRLNSFLLVLNLMYLQQFWTFIERWQDFFSQNKINYYVYIQNLSNIQSVIIYTLLFKLIGKKPVIQFIKKIFFIIQVEQRRTRFRLVGTNQNT